MFRGNCGLVAGAAPSTSTVTVSLDVPGDGSVTPFAAIIDFAPGAVSGVPVPSNAYVEPEVYVPDPTPALLVVPRRAGKVTDEIPESVSLAVAASVNEPA